MQPRVVHGRLLARLGLMCWVQAAVVKGSCTNVVEHACMTLVAGFGQCSVASCPLHISTVTHPVCVCVECWSSAVAGLLVGLLPCSWSSMLLGVYYSVCVYMSCQVVCACLLPYIFQYVTPCYYYSTDTKGTAKEALAVCPEWPCHRNHKPSRLMNYITAASGCQASGIP
jgi:hypothetical protein